MGLIKIAFVLILIVFITQNTLAKKKKSTTQKPKLDKPKADKPKVDKPKVDKPKVDKPKLDKPKVDKSKVDQTPIDKLLTRSKGALIREDLLDQDEGEKRHHHHEKPRKWWTPETKIFHNYAQPRNRLNKKDGDSDDDQMQKGSGFSLFGDFFPSPFFNFDFTKEFGGVSQDKEKESSFENDIFSSCQQPKEPGQCSLKKRRWYFDKKNSKCRQFKYTGCGGNQNNFLTKALCKQLCLGEFDVGEFEGLNNDMNKPDQPTIKNKNKQEESHELENKENEESQPHSDKKKKHKPRSKKEKRRRLRERKQKEKERKRKERERKKKCRKNPKKCKNRKKPNRRKGKGMGKMIDDDDDDFGENFGSEDDGEGQEFDGDFGDEEDDDKKDKFRDDAPGKPGQGPGKKKIKDEQKTTTPSVVYVTVIKHATLPATTQAPTTQSTTTQTTTNNPATTSQIPEITFPNFNDLWNYLTTQVLSTSTASSAGAGSSAATTTQSTSETPWTADDDADDEMDGTDPPDPADPLKSRRKRLKGSRRRKKKKPKKRKKKKSNKQKPGMINID